MRPSRSAVAVLAVFAVLTGCAGIPTSGPVGTAPVVVDDGDGRTVVLAEGPQPGATPDQLLTGFLTAQRAPQGEYSVAREYLTEDFRTEWSPTAHVLVSNTPINPTAEDETTRSFTVNVSAVVNATGNYTELESSEPQRLVYEFEQNADGEWRISSAPQGTLLSSTRFENTFGAYPLYFYEPTGRFLVPDVRWFPDTASRADRIVTELLRGQSPWYAGGVLVTAFPAETTLVDVEIDEGTATVDLSAEVTAQDLDARWRMQQQLAASLAANDVVTVQLTVGGFPVDVGAGSVPDRTLAVRSDPLGFSDGEFGYLARGSVDPVPGISAQLASLAPLGATLARGAGLAAVRNADGVWRVGAGEDPLLVDARAGVLDPSTDGSGLVWSATASGFAVSDASGGSRELSAPLVDGAITAFEVSRDGARLVVATRAAAGDALAIVGIVRDADGMPVGFGEPYALPLVSLGVNDVTWVDPSTVATLERDTDGDIRVELHRIGARRELLGTVDAAVQIVGGNTSDGIRVRDAEGGIWRHSASGGWQSSGVVASFLATQQ